jgi:hypothetical protein
MDPDIQPPAIIEELIIYPTLLNTWQFEIEIATADSMPDIPVVR